MTDSETEATDAAAFLALKAHAEGLERQLHEAEVHSAQRLRQAELKAEAVRAGIVDLDGLRLLDPAVLAGPSGGGAADAGEVIAQLRRDKPWLFAVANSSAAASAPQVAPMKRKLATEMSIDEWRAARTELLRRR